jgi:hypothetical protein
MAAVVLGPNFVSRQVMSRLAQTTRPLFVALAVLMIPLEYASAIAMTRCSDLSIAADPLMNLIFFLGDLSHL